MKAWSRYIYYINSYVSFFSDKYSWFSALILPSFFLFLSVSLYFPPPFLCLSFFNEGKRCVKLVEVGGGGWKPVLLGMSWHSCKFVIALPCHLHLDCHPKELESYRYSCYHRKEIAPLAEQRQNSSFTFWMWRTA